jgi:hypothetical protein
MIRALILVLALLCCAASPASAQSSSLAAAERGSARVVLIMDTMQGQYLFGTGSGFVVAPHLVVTNAHVVAPMLQYGGMTIAVILPEAKEPTRAEIAYYSGSQDYALLRFGGPSPEPLTLSAVEPHAGDPIVSLGYPDVDDLERPAIELIRPTPPSRTSGAIASLRDRAPTGQPIPTINHEAAISSGSSGGPLLDACGRVIGVNTWHARGERTFEGRGVATRAEQLIEFLREAGLRPNVTTERCLTAVERAEKERDTAIAALELRNREISAKLEGAERLSRLTLTALIGGGIFFALALAALAVALFAVRRRAGNGAPTPPAFASVEPSLSAATAPSADSAPPTSGPGAALANAPLRSGWRGFGPKALAIAGGAAAAALLVPLTIQALNVGRNEPAGGLSAKLAGLQQCRFDVGASATQDEDTSFTIDTQACVNGRTPYAPTHDGRALQRVMLHERDGAIEVLTLSPATGELRREQFTLADSERESAAEAARTTPAPNSCSAAAREQVARRNAALMRYAAGAPAQRVVWRCKRRT